MIYAKSAKFPYPLLNNDSDDYKDGTFEFDLNLEESVSRANMILKISNIKIGSKFVKEQIQQGAATLVCIVKSKDSQFKDLGGLGNNEVSIPSGDFIFDVPTCVQLMIRTNRAVSYARNKDLNEFYDKYKDKITVGAGCAMGFSEIIKIDGTQKYHYSLFEKRLDPELQSPIKVEVNDEVIVIVYQNDKVLFQGMQGNSDLIIPYLYIGLQKAFFNFIEYFRTCGVIQSLDEPIDFADLDGSDINDFNPLQTKLYELMINKHIYTLCAEDLDEIIDRISSGMITKYVKTVESVNEDAD